MFGTISVQAHLHEGLAVQRVVVSDHGLTAFADAAQPVAFQHPEPEALPVAPPVPLLVGVASPCA